MDNSIGRIDGIDIFVDSSKWKYYTKENLTQSIIHYSNINTLSSNIVKRTNITQITNNNHQIYSTPTQTYQPSPYRSPDTKYDINEACSYIVSQAHPYYIKGVCGKCAKAVRSAIDIGFNTDPNTTSYTAKTGRPTWAWHYIKYLPTIGFKNIDHIDRNLNGLNGTYVPQVGDIAVYQKNGDPNVPGHICMYTGQIWVSDFKQNGVFVYKNTKEADIFRFVE